MSSHHAFGRGRVFAVLALISAIGQPAWAACSGNTKAEIDPVNQTVPESVNGVATVVQLSGLGSTPKNGELQYAWRFVGSSPVPLTVTINNANSGVANFTVPDVPASGAALTFELKTTCGNQSFATTVVNVTNVNAAPVASVTVDPVNPVEGQVVTLDGHLSYDIDGQPLTYRWEQIDGSPTVELTNANTAVASFIAPNVLETTSLKFRLRVSDGSLASTADQLVNIIWTNDPPVAALICPADGVLDTEEGKSVTFDASGSRDPEGGPLTYAWSQNMGLPNLGIGSFLTPSITFPAPTLGYNQLGLMTVTVTVTDSNLVSSSKSCGLFIKDVTAPRIFVPADITAEATSSGGAHVPYSVTSQDAVEDQSPLPLACVPPSNSLFPLDVSTQVNCTDKDANGNVGTANFQIFVQDTTPPTLNVPGDKAVEATSAAGAVGTYVATQVDLVDGTKDATCSPPSGSTFPLGDTTVTCSAKDSHNNAATNKTFVLSVMDTTAPTIDAKDDLADVEATGPLGAIVTYDAPATHDLVDGDGVAICSPASGTTFPLGQTTIVCNATDSRGNKAKVPETFNVKVVDKTPPTIAPHANIEEVEATSAAGALVNYTAPKWTDLVDGTGDATCLPASGATFALGTTTVTCRHTDKAGNAATPTTFTVEVVDTTPPVIVAHSNILGVEATGPDGAMVEYVAPLWTDAVDGSGSAICEPESGSTFKLGTTTVECNYTDKAGNKAIATTFDVGVRDSTPPAVDNVADILGVEATGPNGATVTYTNPNWTDAVSGSGTATCAPSSGSTFAIASTTVTCSAKDGAGNTGTSTFTIQVIDRTPPSLDLPADITKEATGPSGTSVTFTTSASDIVDGNVAVTCAPASGSTFGISTTTVDCSASDTRGNTAHGSFLVTVKDTTAPTLVLPADMTEEATGPSGAAVSFTATADDIVDGNRAVTCTPASGSTFALGTKAVNCSASDTRGNTAQGSFNVTVEDTTAPVIAPHADVIATATGNSEAIVNFTTPTANDLVDGSVAVSCNPVSGSTFKVGTTVIECEATDQAGNTSTSTFNVIVSYAFAGFFAPVDNPPVVNTVQAGQSIPVKFSLGGYQGMVIFETGFPASSAMACGAAAQDAVEETSTAGSSTLTFDPTTGRYHYVWKTEKAWSGTCRQLKLKFKDGKTQVANFYFKK